MILSLNNDSLMFESFACIRSSRMIDYLNLPLDRAGFVLVKKSKFLNLC